MQAPTEPPAISADDIAKIRELIAQADQFGSSQAAQAAHRLRICVEVGGMFETWKKSIPRGQWETWCDEQFPDFNKVTRCRWMRAYTMHAAGRLDLESARGIRHAYSLIGILPDSETSGIKAAKAPDSWLTHLARLVRSLQLINLDDLSEPEKNTLAERLEAITKFIAKLRATSARQAG